jgi:hypothetical protein
LFPNLRPILIDRNKCHFEKLIGQPYGFQYEIVNQQLNLFKEEDDQTEENTDKNQIEIDIKDNRNLNDDSLNQKLTTQDIDKMKKEEELHGDVCIY